MGKGGGFLSADPLGRMLADKRSAADARARLAARMRHDRAAPATEAEKPTATPGDGANGVRSNGTNLFRAHLLSGVCSGADAQKAEAALLKVLGPRALPSPGFPPPRISPVAAVGTPVAEEGQIICHGDRWQQPIRLQRHAPAITIGHSNPVKDSSPPKEDIHPQASEFVDPAGGDDRQGDRPPLATRDVGAPSPEDSHQNGGDETRLTPQYPESDLDRLATAGAHAGSAPAANPAPGFDTPLTQLIRESIFAKSASPSLWTSCLGDLTLEDYANDRGEVAKRLATIPPFLLPENIPADILEVLDEALALAGQETRRLEPEDASESNAPPAAQRPDDIDPPSRPPATSLPELAVQSLNHDIAQAEPIAAPRVAPDPSANAPTDRRSADSPRSAEEPWRRFFPPDAVSRLDVEAAQQAIAALSKNGFDGVRAYKEISKAKGLLAQLGYKGTLNEAALHLGQMLGLALLPPSPAPSTAAETIATKAAAREPARPPAAPEEETPLEDETLPEATVADLLGWAAPSVRLHNVAQTNSTFSEWTIQDAIDRRDEFLSEVRTLQNAGAKTVDELSRILDDYQAGRIEPPDATTPLRSEQTDDIEDALADPRYDALVVDILRDHPLSMRGERIVDLDSLKTLRLRDFAQNPNVVAQAASGAPNIGRRTIEEVAVALSAQLAAIEGADNDQITDSGTDSATPRSRMLAAVRALGARQAEVVRRRYGLDGGTKETLQEIADSLGNAGQPITRERVRQIQSAALRRLAKPPARKAVDAFIRAEQDEQWTRLTGTHDHLQFEDLPSRTPTLDPLFVLAAQVQFKTLDGWLDACAVRQTGRWQRDTERGRTFSDAVEVLDDLYGICPSPMPLESLLPAPDGGADKLQAATYHSPSGWGMFEGYFYSEHFGSRLKRRVRLHSLATKIAASGLFDVGALVRAYREQQPDDEVTSRVLLKEISEAPHLFACLFDSVWLTLPPKEPIQRLAAPPVERMPIGDDAFKADSTSSAIRSFLDGHPRHLADIAAMISEANLANRSSAVPILLGSPLFRRAAPGIYSIAGQEEAARESMHEEMLNDGDCRLYCLARRSGAPIGFYPAWDGEYEKALTMWARPNAETDLFRSLLAVIEPTKWPVREDVARDVERVAHQEGRWAIGFDRKAPLGHRFVDPQGLLAVLAYLAAFGSIGWVAVNRLTGAKIDQSDAADVLAFLMLTGLVEPQRDWQAPHTAAPVASQVFAQAASRLHRLGRLEWDDCVLKPVMARLDAAPDAIGWAPASEVATAIQAWKSGRLGTGRAYDGAGNGAPPDVDDTFKSESWISIFGA